ncbi:hypothetical protein BGZ96_001852 [Linnemannia gamsii]|uniref:WD40 repeat-like protein n=1 Tax=Linnemannia gamsii TaxID=64522 RepID=A0ABQ7JLY0_9FUNG|nr:hypothetical protein BGZ96_001852 [Linnemannia gamsii]
MHLASGSEDKTVRLWGVTTAGAELDLGDGQSGSIRTVAYSPDGRSLFSSNNSGIVQQYDTVTGDLGIFISCGTRQAESVAISPDSRRIATAGWSRVIRTWNAGTGVSEFILRGHKGWINTLAYSPDGQWIASGSVDKTMRLWDARSGTLGLLSSLIKAVVTVAFSPCGLEVVAGNEDGTIRVWDMGTGESRVTVNAWSDIEAVALQYLQLGKLLALTRKQGGCVELWNEGGVEPLFTQGEGPLFTQGDLIRTAALSSCGQWISIVRNKAVQLWSPVLRDSVQRWECVLVIQDFLREINSIAWRPNALEFVASSEAGCVQAWRLVEKSSGGFSARLIWRKGQSTFAATDAVIIDTVNLSEMNQRLLKQRGAKDGLVSSYAISDGNRHELFDDNVRRISDEVQDEIRV